MSSNTIYKWQYYNSSDKGFRYLWDTTAPTLSGSDVSPARAVSQVDKYTTSETDISQGIYGFTFYRLSPTLRLIASLPNPGLDSMRGRYLFFQRGSTATANIEVTSSLLVNTSNTISSPHILNTSLQTVKLVSKYLSTAPTGGSVGWHWVQLELSTNVGEDYVNMNGYVFDDKNVALNADVRARKLNGLGSASGSDDTALLKYNHGSNSLNPTVLKINGSTNVVSGAGTPDGSDPTAVVNIDYLNNNFSTAVPVSFEVLCATTSSLSGLSASDGPFTISNSDTTYIDGILLHNMNIGSLILVKDQVSSNQNGVYELTAKPTSNTVQLTRATNFNIAAISASGKHVNVLSGETQSATLWVVDSPASADTIGTNNITFTKLYDVKPSISSKPLGVRVKYSTNGENISGLADSIFSNGNFTVTGNVDGVDITTLTAGTYILIQDQSGVGEPLKENGVYEVISSGVISRVIDFGIAERVHNKHIYVDEGTHKGKLFVISNLPGEDLVGANDIKFQEIENRYLSSSNMTVTNLAIPVYDGTDGEFIKESVVTISAAGVISNVSTPLVNTDVANKLYVDERTVTAPLGFQALYAVQSNISGITGSSNGTFNITNTNIVDGTVTFGSLTVGDVLLFNSQTNAVENGVYYVTAQTATTDIERYANFQVTENAYHKYVHVAHGTNAGSLFLVENLPVADTIGTDNILFVEILNTYVNTSDMTVTNLAVPVYDGTTGEHIKQSVVTISSGGVISNVASPILGTDAANKAYVDALSSGLKIVGDVDFATTANIPITITGSIIDVVDFDAASSTVLEFDKATIGNGDYTILVKNQTDPIYNGVYKLTVSGGAITVAVRQNSNGTYFTTGSNAAGSFVYVLKGSVNKRLGFVCIADPPNDIVGTDDLEFVSFSVFSDDTQLDVFNYSNSTEVSNSSPYSDWYTLPFNVDAVNNADNVTVSGNSFTVKPGKYEVNLSGVFYGTGNSSIRLFNETDERVYDFSVSPAPLYSEDPNDIVPIVFKTILNVNSQSTKLYKFEYKATTAGRIFIPNTINPLEKNGVSILDGAGNTATRYNFDPDGPIAELDNTTGTFTTQTVSKGYTVTFLRIE